MPDSVLESMNIDVVFDWANELRNVDTTGVEPMFSPARHNLPRRTDTVTSPNIRAEILANTPDKTGVSRGYFAVPKVMDGD